MEKFAEYGFNKSHSAAYALIAYQTAYLKAHYPVEFMAALLTEDMENTDKVIKNINEIRNMGIDPAARHQRVAPRLHRARHRHPLRPRRGQGGRRCCS
jgi:DNA polymerase III alpha subunit